MADPSSEAGVVQGPLVRYATEAGWEHVPGAEALRLRRGETGTVFHEVLVERLQELNPGVMDLGTAEEVVARLIRVRPTIEGNLDAWEFLKGLKTVFVAAEGRERNLRLLDPEHPGANSFHVTDELRFTSGTHAVRADVVFFINGVPVIIVETKAATRQSGIAEALDQLRRVRAASPKHWISSVAIIVKPPSCWR